MSAADSLAMHADGRLDIFETEPGAGSLPQMRATRDDVEQIGATGWASPPPPKLSTNWLVFGQLGLWLAVLLLIRGEQIVAWIAR